MSGSEGGEGRGRAALGPASPRGGGPGGSHSASGARGLAAPPRSCGWYCGALGMRVGGWQGGGTRGLLEGRTLVKMPATVQPVMCQRGGIDSSSSTTQREGTAAPPRLCKRVASSADSKAPLDPTAPGGGGEAGAGLVGAGDEVDGPVAPRRGLGEQRPDVPEAPRPGRGEGRGGDAWMDGKWGKCGAAGNAGECGPM